MASPGFATFFKAGFPSYIIMKTCIIYHSETGNTRHVAQHLAAACDGKLVEVSDTRNTPALPVPCLV